MSKLIKRFFKGVFVAEVEEGPVTRNVLVTAEAIDAGLEKLEVQRKQLLARVEEKQRTLHDLKEQISKSTLEEESGTPEVLSELKAGSVSVGGLLVNTVPVSDMASAIEREARKVKAKASKKQRVTPPPPAPPAKAKKTRKKK